MKRTPDEHDAITCIVLTRHLQEIGDRLLAEDRPTLAQQAYDAGRAVAELGGVLMSDR